MSLTLTLFWCHYCQLHTQSISCPGVFSVSIVDLKQAKSQVFSKSYRPKSNDVTLLLFVRNVWFIIVRGKIRICSTSKLGLFAKLVYSVKSLTILIRRPILRSITGCWICLVYFFRFAFYLQFFYWFILLIFRLLTFFLVYIVCIHACIYIPL